MAVAVDNRGAVGGVARSVGIEGFPEGVSAKGDHFAPVFFHQPDSFVLEAGFEKGFHNVVIHVRSGDIFYREEVFDRALHDFFAFFTKTA